MRRVSVALFFIGLSIGCGSISYAADMPAKAPVYKAPIMVPFSWTGFYVGVHGGADWFNKDWSLPLTPINIAGGCPGCPTTAGSHSASGGLFGGQIGFNYQIDSWVLGIEAQASWTNLNGSNVSSFAATITNNSKTKSLGTVAGRLGWAWGHTMLYGKGGFAWAQDTFWTTKAACVGTCQTLNDTRWGWMLGVGAEYAFTRNWSVKAEYDYMNFGTRRETLQPVCIGCLAAEYDIKQTIRLVKLGLNYRF